LQPTEKGDMPLTILTEQPRSAEAVRGTILFADLRGYTTLAEQLRPVSVVALLDEFFAILAEAIEARGGTVFHSAGDSIMAGFGLSDAGPGPVRGAVDAARRIVAAFEPVSERWQRRIGVSTGVGVGLNVGEVALTELGPAHFRRRTLIGDTVNVAARLCQRARAGEVLLSANVLDSLETTGADGLIALPDFIVRGRDTPVRIFCVPARERVALGRPAADEPEATPAAIR
jgi:adenylate cyclase